MYIVAESLDSAFEWARRSIPALNGRGPSTIRIEQRIEDQNVWDVTFEFGESEVFKPSEQSALVGA
jgi:hypothetical protein